MRNLAQYPVTTEEVSRILDGIRADIEKQQTVGDTRLLVLRYVARFLTQNETALASFLVAEQPYAEHPKPVVDPAKAAKEAIAEIIYDLLPYDDMGEKPAWVPGGNSFKQDWARNRARQFMEHPLHRVDEHTLRKIADWQWDSRIPDARKRIERILEDCEAAKAAVENQAFNLTLAEDIERTKVALASQLSTAQPTTGKDEPFVPHKPCRTYDRCRREGFCDDPWNCSSGSDEVAQVPHRPDSGTILHDGDQSIAEGVLDRFNRCVSTLVSSDYAAGYREACQHIIERQRDAAAPAAPAAKNDEDIWVFAHASGSWEAYDDEDECRAEAAKHGRELTVRKFSGK